MHFNGPCLWISCENGNTHFDHKKQQAPGVDLDYDLILDGRSLERPVNFSLSASRTGVMRMPLSRSTRTTGKIPWKKISRIPPNGPSLLSIPGAGHGPGIGGSKRDSEIGMALNEGHPVYFFVFSADPMQGQTLVDVHNAQIQFIEEIIKRHPAAENRPLSATAVARMGPAHSSARTASDITGPMVFNGSPLSYWAGVKGKNPMRYRGGLFGGVWLTSLWNDLGNGIFDGANLVAGFEDLNPANTLWEQAVSPLCQCGY
ncbi:MAG: DUF3141 domain-containing protein [Desulfobacterales bacterium]